MKERITKETLDESTKELIRKALKSLDDAHYAFELAHDAVNDEMIDCNPLWDDTPYSDYSHMHEFAEENLATMLDWFEYEMPKLELGRIEGLV